MWAQGEDGAESEGERGSSSEDERDIQCEILESQRDDAHQQLCDLEAVSSQLLKEMNVLEIQFHIERSCRESAEALAVKVTKENKVLKRASQMTTMMPLIPELPENWSAVTFDPQADPPEAEETLLLENQAKIAVSQLVTEEFTDMSQKLELEQGLRQHAEVFAHQV
ncbi:Shootin-1 [Liparis tanakae]|uniref:Shootin-1 n=1 Tax=Liparis tanakae TaxID=230148 RepID=A0A4Z2FWV8_9TELE|nr:Shootin-1 [Liparis tanakae]